MKKSLYILSAVFLLLSVFSQTVFSLNTQISTTIMPGTFYFNVYGGLQSGIALSGLHAPSGDPQTGYWDGVSGTDYLSFFDSTAVEGFKMKMALGSDFIYSGSSDSQADLPAENFKVYAEWIDDSGSVPLVAIDDLSKALSINSAGSCVLAVPARFSFNASFSVDENRKSFSTSLFDYVVSDVPCIAQGVINMGRFELYMGNPSAGSYKSSMYIVMVDG